MPEHAGIAIKKEVLQATVHVSFDHINNSHSGSFTPRKEPRYPQYKRLGRPYGVLDGSVEYNIPCPPSVFETRALHPVVRVAIPSTKYCDVTLFPTTMRISHTRSHCTSIN